MATKINKSDSKTTAATMARLEPFEVNEEAPPAQLINPATEKKILKKLDFRVVPMLWLLFLISFIDRGNIANAKIQGMDEELHLVGNDYNNTYWVFTLSYVVFGVPANLLFKKVGPKSLSVMMFCWGLTVLGQGFSRNYADLVVCRFLEGICEAGFVPGCASLIGSYYQKDEFLRRYCVFFSAATIAGAFNGVSYRVVLELECVLIVDSSLLAYLQRWTEMPDILAGDGIYTCIREVTGAPKLKNDRIFIIESLITIVIAFASYFVMIEFPEKTKIFTTEEKTVLIARLHNDDGEPIDDRKKEILKSLRDWKIWVAYVPSAWIFHFAMGRVLTIS